MNEFKNLIREAFVGEERFDPTPGRAALEAAIAQLERRDRVYRVLSWFMVTFMSGVAVWAAWSFLGTPPDAPTKTLLLYAVVFLWAIGGIFFGKLFLFLVQPAMSIQKELRRMQIARTERP